jgi:hypothetical protein
MLFHTDEAGRVSIIFFSEYQKLLRNPPLQGYFLTPIICFIILSFIMLGFVPQPNLLLTITFFSILIL